MKVKEFIEGFNKASDKNSYVKNCLVTDYIDFERKVTITSNSFSIFFKNF